MLAEQRFSMQHILIADNKISRANDIFSAINNILALPLYHIKQFQHIIMLMQQLRMLFVIFFVHKMKINESCGWDYTVHLSSVPPLFRSCRILCSQAEDTGRVWQLNHHRLHRRGLTRCPRVYRFGRDPPCLTAGQLLESGLFAAAIKRLGRPFLLFFRWIDAKSITVLHEITAFHALLYHISGGFFNVVWYFGAMESV